MRFDSFPLLFLMFVIKVFTQFLDTCVKNVKNDIFTRNKIQTQKIHKILSQRKKKIRSCSRTYKHDEIHPPQYVEWNIKQVWKSTDGICCVHRQPPDSELPDLLLILSVRGFQVWAKKKKEGNHAEFFQVGLFFSCCGLKLSFFLRNVWGLCKKRI